VKYALLLSATAIIIVAVVAVNVLQYQDQRTEEYCANRTGLHGSEIVVNCTNYKAEETNRLQTHMNHFLPALAGILLLVFVMIPVRGA